MIEDILLVYRAYIQHALFFAVTIAAWKWGGVPERWATTTFTAMIFADYLLHIGFPSSGQNYSEVIIGHLAIDACVFVALIPLALKANRIYPLCLLAAQLIQMLSHVQREALPTIEDRVYFVLTVGPSYVQLLTLALGLLAHIRRVRQFGPYRAWRRC